MSRKYTYYDRARMRKTALLGDIGDMGINAIKLVGDIGAVGATYLIAGTVLGGVGAGWLGAKLTAHGKADLDTVRKSYDNERLKADIGYVAGKAREEYEALQRKTAPKAARLIN